MRRLEANVRCCRYRALALYAGLKLSLRALLLIMVATIVVDDRIGIGFMNYFVGVRSSSHPKFVVAFTGA